MSAAKENTRRTIVPGKSSFASDGKDAREGMYADINYDEID
jgi:hypothetical protein